MARMTFNVPDDLARAFDEALEGQNKSDVMAALMREAIERVGDRRVIARLAAQPTAVAQRIKRPPPPTT
jgi:metal-responsive CopG/Arc/MetJ family transcriptional regulator